MSSSAVIAGRQSLSQVVFIGAITTSALCLTAPIAQPVQLADGMTYFVNPPRLVGAVTTHKSADAWTATYYFTLNIPANAGEPLQRVTIAQNPSPDRIRYLLPSTEAFEGSGWNGGPQLPLKNVTQDPETAAVSVVFDPPVSPGKTITIALSPNRNPSLGGVYLFGVTAYPAGEKAYGQFLGYGRLTFYDRLRFW